MGRRKKWNLWAYSVQGWRGNACGLERQSCWRRRWSHPFTYALGFVKTEGVRQETRSSTSLSLSATFWPWFNAWFRTSNQCIARITIIFDDGLNGRLRRVIKSLAYTYKLALHLDEWFQWHLWWIQTTPAITTSAATVILQYEWYIWRIIASPG